MNKRGADSLKKKEKDTVNLLHKREGKKKIAAPVLDTARGRR